MSAQTLIEDLREISPNERDKGKLFEKLIAAFFKLDPQYSEILSDVWLWDEWPLNGGKVDTGIDLVALTRDGNYWAIQCKFFDPDHTIQKSDIDSFFTASGKRFTDEEGKRHSFAQRVVVSTTDKWGKHAEDALADQTIPVFRIGIQELAASPIDWEKARPYTPEDLRLRRKKTLMEHQEEALASVREGYQGHERGKLIMACGTGKTFTSLKIAEELTPSEGLVLFLAPSISLVSQTLREWTAEATDPIHAFAVCSDSKVGRDNEDIQTHDLAYPATTDAKKLHQAIEALGKGRRKVIFSTYQSIDVIADAQKLGLPAFDLIICDEAHRTTGLTLPNEDASNFVKVHDNSVVSGDRRLYMTATPRVYGEASKSKANDASAVLYSMDNEEWYGPVFYRLDFGKAVSKGLLTDYKVLIVAVDQDRMAKTANTFNMGEGKNIDIRFATKIIGSWKGLSKKGLKLVDEDHQEDIQDDTRPMQRAVAFSSSIQKSKDITKTFTLLTESYLKTHEDEQDAALVHCELDHVDGTMNALVRQSKLEWLKEPMDEGECRILSNARCLSEGIDVPALDSVIFFDTRESIVDIVQSVGRVMRCAPGKEYGYIILPVAIPFEKTQDLETLNRWVESDPQFKGIWKVIKALRAHDESLVDEAEFRRKIDVIRGTEGGGDEGGGEQLPIQFPALPIDSISDAVYAAIPKKLGDREYWSEWAKDVAKIAERLIARIREMLNEPDAHAAMDKFLDGLHQNINPSVSEDEAVEMLAQHIITRPVFEAIFEGYSFTSSNPVSQAMQAVIDALDARAVDAETSDLEKFYRNVQERVSLAKSDKSKQGIIHNLYDTFFKHGFPKVSERLGIVYTPVEVVDFIIKSAEHALNKHFDASLSDQGVQILDPFTGTGTFITRLLQSGLIRPDDLAHKYQHELHANEIVLLAYYIAAINIESTYHAITDEYRPFDGIVLTDTFQMTEDKQATIQGFSEENSERVNRQKRQPIRVIISNPPYSAGQGSANDNNQNLHYPQIDERIRDTFANRSTATNRNSLYDSYIRAIRWASDRIEEQGIIGFVTNGSFIDGNAADGLRKCLTDEFSHLYVFNLRGNQRTSGEESRREGGKIFGSGSRTPVAITLMVKDPEHAGPCELKYHDIGDYLTRENKLAIIENAGNIEGLEWRRITPNEEGDWINQRDPAFDRFIAFGDKTGNEDHVVFEIYSSGVKTNRDAWVYNFSKERVEDNMRRMVATYNEEAVKYQHACEGLTQNKWPDPQNVVSTDPKKISWNRGLLHDVKRSKTLNYTNRTIVPSIYRPFTKEWLYFDRRLNDMVYQQPRLFPTPEHENIVISVTGRGATKSSSALASKMLPDLEMISNGQCFPMYWYEKADESSSHPQGGLDFDSQAEADEQGYIRHDAISDWVLGVFQKHYQDDAITREDLFWYVYGILHSPDYKSRFAANLKRELARLPFAEDFRAFSDAGRKLGEMHLNYEEVEPWPVHEETKLIMGDDDWCVTKMKFARKDKETNRSVIIYNRVVQLMDIPLNAYEYQVNGKSAIEWIMDRYRVKTDKASGIVNDPNDWSDDPRYIINLLKKVIRVSVESVGIIKSLPPLNEQH